MRLQYYKEPRKQGSNICPIFLMKIALKVTSICRGYSTIMNLGHRSVLLNEMKTALK